MNKDWAEEESDVLAKLVEMPEGERTMPQRLCDHYGQHASPRAENLVWDAHVCQGWQGRLLAELVKQAVS